MIAPAPPARTGLGAALAITLALVFPIRAGDAQTAATPPEPLQSFRDCDRCPEMVTLPAGSYVMGFDGPHPSERPAHEVRFAKPFAIGKYEVTFDEWAFCQESGGCNRMPDDHHWGRGSRPVINVTFDDAVDFARWLGKKTGATYRLATEAEWEYAARGGTQSEFWWGDQVGVNNANCRDCGSAWSQKGSAPTGSFRPNPFGLFDTTGNVWEWVQDCWNPDHKGAFADGRARLTGDCKQRVMRGGSWYYFSKNARSAWRFKNDARVESYGIGFRVVREFP